MSNEDHDLLVRIDERTARIEKDVDSLWTEVQSQRETNARQDVKIATEAAKSGGMSGAITGGVIAGVVEAIRHWWGG